MTVEHQGDLAMRHCARPVILILALSVLVACSAVDTQPKPYRSHHGAGGNQPTVAILGATGLTGGYLVREALERGYKVRALVRNPDRLGWLTNDVSIIVGDALDPAALRKLLEGSDVVASAIGPVRSDGDAAKMISTNVSRLLIDLMPEYAVSRYIVVSGAGVEVSGDELSVTGWMVRTLAALRFPSTLQDKQAEYEMLARSNVHWTLVRCPLIQDEKYQRPPNVSLTTVSSFHVRAGELASFVIDQLQSTEFIGQSPFIASFH